MKLLRILTKWVRGANRNDSYPALTFAGMWTDVTGQSDVEVAHMAALILEGVVDDTTFTAVQAGSGVALPSLLIWWGDWDGATLTNDNQASQVTAPQVTAFKTWVANNWPGANLTNINATIDGYNLVGKTRLQTETALRQMLFSRATAGQ